MSRKRNNIIHGITLALTSAIPGPVDDLLALPIAEFLTQNGIDPQGKTFQQALQEMSAQLRAKDIPDGSDIDAIYDELDD